MKKQIQNRRDFIRLGIAGAAAGLAVPYLSLGKEFLTATCVPTTPDIIGPYYLANAPSNIQLSSPTEPGTPIVISDSFLSVVFNNEA